MKRNDCISDETISALIDDELNDEDRLELLDRATKSDELMQRICEAEKLKTLLLSAYPLAETERPNLQRRNFLHIASYAAVTGLSALGAYSLLNTQHPNESVITTTGHKNEHSPKGIRTQVIFHISSEDAALADLLLEQVAFLLKYYQNIQHPVQLEVIANNDGLRILQSNRSPYPGRIRLLTEQYQNLLFAACGTTLTRLQAEHGESIQILPQAIIIRSGVAFIARRQAQGWSYIKV